MEAIEIFVETVDAAGEAAVAAALGFTPNPDAPEDLAEDMIAAFEGLRPDNQEQAIRVLRMRRLVPAGL